MAAITPHYSSPLQSMRVMRRLVAVLEQRTTSHLTLIEFAVFCLPLRSDDNIWTSRSGRKHIQHSRSLKVHNIINLKKLSSCTKPRREGGESVLVDSTEIFSVPKA